MEFIKMLSTNDSHLPKEFYDACFDLSSENVNLLVNELNECKQYVEKIKLIHNKNLSEASLTSHVDCMLYLYTREECRAPDKYVGCVDDCYGDDLDLILTSLITNNCVEKFKEHLQCYLHILPDYWDLVVSLDRFECFKHMVSLGFEDEINVAFSVAKGNKLRYIVYLHEALDDVTLWDEVKYVCSGECLDYINSL